MRKRKAVSLVEVHDKLVLRAFTHADIPSLIAIDTKNTGVAKPEYWRRKLAPYVVAYEASADAGGNFLTRAAEIDGNLVGFLIGEIRQWEFGQTACGWITALGVDPQWQKLGIGRRLLAELLDYYREQSMPDVRTIVELLDADLLRFFHSMGFVRGPYVELQKLL